MTERAAGVMPRRMVSAGTTWGRVAGRLVLGPAVLVGLVSGFVSGCSGAVSPDAADVGKTSAIVVTPATSMLAVGAALPLQALPQDRDGRTVPNVDVFWFSADTSVATVSSAGVVTARAVGTAQISANADGASAISTITVVPVPVSSVTVVPTSGTIDVGTTLGLQAVTYDAVGAVLSGRYVIWSTSAPQVATVDQSGTVTGVAAGTATISATSEGKSGTATVTVRMPSPPPAPTVDTIIVTPAGLSLARGQTATLTADLHDVTGALVTGQTVSWTSSNSSIVSVLAATGATTTIRAKAKSGQAIVTAAAGGHHTDVVVRTDN